MSETSETADRREPATGAASPRPADGAADTRGAVGPRADSTPEGTDGAPTPASRPRQGHQRGLVAPGVLAIVALGLVGLWWFGIWPFAGEQEEPGTAAARHDGPIAVTATVAALEQIPVFYAYNGLTSPSRRAEIRPRVSGYIETIAFREGSDVDKGDLLYRLDARPFEATIAQAQAEREALEASLAFAEAQVARFAELAEDGFATGARYDEALSRREELRGELAATDAQIAAAEINLRYTEVRAPFTGRIGLSTLNEGELASPGGPALTTLVQLDPIEVRFAIRDNELGAIRRARLGPEPVRAVLLLDDDEAYARYGTLFALDNTIDPATGTLTALARFPNPAALLPAGRFVDLRLVFGRTEALLIPAAALSANLNRRIVYIVRADGTAAPVPVEIGRRIEEHVVVLSGLRPGDRVVTSNLQAVRPGVAVRIVPRQPLRTPAPSADGGGAEEADGTSGAGTGVGAGAARTQGDMAERPAPLAPPAPAARTAPQGADVVIAPAPPDGAPGAAAGEVPLVGTRPLASTRTPAASASGSDAAPPGVIRSAPAPVPAPAPADVPSIPVPRPPSGPGAAAGAATPATR